MSNEKVLDLNFFIDTIKGMAELTEVNRDYWTELDSNIGDGDHGINLSIGFRAVTKYIDETDLTQTDIKTFLKKVGMTLLGKVGGASGPLYGSLFLKMPASLTDETSVSVSEFAQMLIDGIDGIKDRGKAVVGEKTMVDALEPGRKVLDENKENITSEVLDKLIDDMKEGSETTIPLIATKGRAMRLGERAIGHKDPGSESSWMLFNVIKENLLPKLN